MNLLLKRVGKVLLTVFLLSANNAVGQGTGYLYSVPVNGLSSIVRYVPSAGNHIVYKACMTTLRENYFLLTDMVNVIDVHISDLYDISDFEIIDNYVFFCGYLVYGSSRTGILGWFDIDSLFYYGAPVHIDQSLYMLGLETLDNIEVFRETSGRLHVAGYGEATSLAGSVGTYYRAFEAVGYLPGYLNGRTSDLWRYSARSKIVDMVVTDNYVVYLESESVAPPGYSPYGMGISLFPFPKYNMLSSTTMTAFFFQTVTYNNFPNFIIPDYEDPYRGEAKMTFINKDEVAVCSYRRDFDPLIPHSPLSQNYLVYRIYDIIPFLSNNPIVMTSAAMASIPGDVNTINSFEYDLDTCKFVVLHQHEVMPGVAEHAITTIDIALGTAPASIRSDYQSAYSTSSYWTPEKLCLDGASDYTVIGHTPGMNDQIIWQNVINTVDGTCSKSVLYPMQPIETMMHKVEYEEVGIYGWVKLDFPVQPLAKSSHTICKELCSPNKDREDETD